MNAPPKRLRTSSMTHDKRPSSRIIDGNYSTNELDFPIVDLHAHLPERWSLTDMVQLAQERGITFGIVEHGGHGQLIDNDNALLRYVKSLEEYPVYKGIQAEGLNWADCFSPQTLDHLDYVLSDALTFPEHDGLIVRLWTPEAHIDNTETAVASFMDRYVDFNVQVMTTPINILANPTFLPSCIRDRYDELWTHECMEKVIKTAIQHSVAIEINARYAIPSAAFIHMAKEAGVRFTFGSNYHGADVGKLDYCLRISSACKLTRQDIYLPGEST